MTQQHWAIPALMDIREALPAKAHWVAREHITDAIAAIRAIEGDSLADPVPVPRLRDCHC